jgi:thiol:disulfide interchange protein DsbD
MNRALPLLIAVVLLAPAVRADGLWAPKSAGGHDLLKAAQAFHLVSVERHGATLKVDWDIAPGYYLYRKRLGFHVVAPGQARLQPPQLPAGEMVEDEQGKSEVYRASLQAALRWSGNAPPQQLRVDFQGCAEAGVCYPPQSQLIDVVDLGG